jgi:cullin 2
MVADHLVFLHGECKAMVQEERRKDLANMYPLLRSVKDGIGVLIDEVLEHTKAQGLETVRGLKGDNVSKKSNCSKITNI